MRVRGVYVRGGPRPGGDEFPAKAPPALGAPPAVRHLRPELLRPELYPGGAPGLRAHHGPLELPRHALLRAPGGGGGGGEHGALKTLGLRAQHLPRHGGAGGLGVPPGACGGGGGRPGGERGPAGPVLRPHLLHRQRRRGPGGAGKSGPAPHPRDPGAGGQEPGDRGKKLRHRAHRPARRLRQALKLRPNLRGPGLSAGGAAGPRRAS